MFKKKINVALYAIAVFTLFISINSCNGGGKAGENDSTRVSNNILTDLVASNPKFIRYNCASTQGLANLQAMETALAIMRKYPCDKGYSWYYQGAIHGAADSIAGSIDSLCPSYYGTPSQLQNQLKVSWDNCTHYTGADLHFLLWHRIYIWYFEKIVRKLSGKADFALPYWDYTNPAHRAMPPLFWKDKHGSLYTASRLSSLNAGLPIDSTVNDNGFTNALDMTTDYQCKTYFTFNSALETAPHNAMHIYIGGADSNGVIYNEIHQFAYLYGGLMYDPGTAGFDPIFFVHHANIDYLFETWNKSSNGAMPNLKQLESMSEEQPYVFFDENGNKVVWTIAQALDLAYNLDYVYDTLAPNLDKVQKPKAAVPENRQEVLSIDMQSPLKAKTQLFNLKILAPVVNKVETLNALDLSKKSTILSVTVGFMKEPRSLYNVYIDTDKEDKAKLAGVIAFFGATMNNMKGMEMHKPGSEYTKTFIFDVTDELNVKNIKEKIKIFIVKKGTRPGTESEISLKNVKLETIDN